MNLFHFLLFGGMLIAASTAFSVPRNNKRAVLHAVATVHLESPLFGGPFHHDVLASATEPSFLPFKIKQRFGAVGQCLCRRPALLRKVLRVVVTVALCLAILCGPGILPAQAHPPTIAQTQELILKRLDGMQDEMKSFKDEMKSFNYALKELKLDIKVLDQKYIFVPLASATAASLTSAVLNKLFKSSTPTNPLDIRLLENENTSNGTANTSNGTANTS
jgi:hypothetical protein